MNLGVDLNGMVIPGMGSWQRLACLAFILKLITSSKRVKPPLPFAMGLSSPQPHCAEHRLVGWTISIDGSLTRPTRLGPARLARLRTLALGMLPIWCTLFVDAGWYAVAKLSFLLMA